MRRDRVRPLTGVRLWELLALMVPFVAAWIVFTAVLPWWAAVPAVVAVYLLVFQAVRRLAVRRQRQMRIRPVRNGQ